MASGPAGGSAPGRPSRGRRLGRTVLVLIPVLLIAQLLWVFFDIVRLRSIDSEQLFEVFSAHLEERDSRPLPQFSPAGTEERQSGPAIWVLGASSIYFPQGETFVEQLAMRLRADSASLQVANLGVSGVESRALVEKFEETLARSASPPVLLIVYAGHNDYNVLYHASLARSFDLFEPLFHLLAPFTRPGLRHGMTVYLRTRVPPLLEWLQRGGMLDLSHLDLTAVNSVVAARFRQNLEVILGRCKARGTEVWLVTPVGNLLVRPYGAQATTASYEWGMALPGGATKLALLRRAQESEFVTFDIRAKRGAREALTSLVGPGTTLVDLDSWLVAHNLRLDTRLFVDYFHFTKWGHARIVECLLEMLAQRPELRSRLGLTREVTAGSP